MTHDCNVIRLAGTDISYRVPHGDNLLRAGLRAGIGLPYECNAGGCGSCKFEIVSGEVEDLWPDAPGLNAKDHVKGRRLACQCRPLGDCEIKMRPSATYVPPIAPARMAARFRGSRIVTADIKEFTFCTEQSAQFLPGQYALLEVPGTEQFRAYSMSNQPNKQGDWNFMIRRVPGGKMSHWLFDKLEPGQPLFLDGPYGLAYLRTETPRNVVCIAGGSGLAPMLAVANAAAVDPALSERTITFLYGARGPADIPRFSDWLDQSGRVQCTAAVSVAELADQAQWTGERGFVHELLARSLQGDLTANEYYLAGPPPMIETVVRTLMLDHQVAATQIHFDRFF